MGSNQSTEEKKCAQSTKKVMPLLYLVLITFSIILLIFALFIFQTI